MFHHPRATVVSNQFVVSWRTFMRVFVCVAAVWAQFGWLASTLQAQPQGANEPPMEQRELDCKGSVVAVEGNVVGIETDKDKQRWLLRVDHDADVIVKGSAESSYLRAGQVVRLVGAIDEKGNLETPLKEIEVYTPEGKAAFGLFSKNAADDAKPERKTPAGAYQIRGKIRTVKDRHIEIAAGAKKISGDLAEGCKISVRLHDLSLAQESDKVEAVGWFTDSTRPDPAKQKPGRAVIHKRITVTLTNPLEGATKKKQPVGRAASLNADK